MRTWRAIRTLGTTAALLAALRYACIWLDVYGALDPHSIAYAPQRSDSLAFVLHYGDGTTFRTTFVYDRAADSWTMNMDSEASGKTTPFARTQLTRVAATGS